MNAEFILQYLPYFFIGLGIGGLFIVAALKKKINDYYDGITGLSASHANYYKYFIVYIIPAIFIIAGIIQLLTDSKINQNSAIADIITLPVDIRRTGGFLCMAYGILTIIIRFSNYKYKLFSKLLPMEEQQGRLRANFIHTINYSVIPFLFGLYLVFIND